MRYVAQLRREFNIFRTYFVRKQQRPTTKFTLYFRQKKHTILRHFAQES